MKFKVGDKVKFLNESGGGIVTKVLSGNMVNVTIEEGFDIPTLTSDIIKTGLPQDGGSFFEEKIEVEIAPDKLREAEEEGSERISPISQYSSFRASLAGIYLSFVPQDQKWLITGLIDIFLINNTDYEALYSHYLKNADKKAYSGVDYDLIPPKSMIHLETIDRDSIEKWSAGIIQVLLHTDEIEKVLLPVNSEYNIKPTRFYKENNYTESSFFPVKAIVITLAEAIELIPKDRPLREKEEKKQDSISETKTEQKGIIHEVEEIIDKYRVKDKKPSSFFKLAEVDLHIHELIEDHSKMNPHEILKHQVDHFIKCLESAIRSRYSKVIFIHGIGNGSLRNAIIEKLNEYDYIQYGDAILSKYGKGAVEVKFFYTKQ